MVPSGVNFLVVGFDVIEEVPGAYGIVYQIVLEQVSGSHVFSASAGDATLYQEESDRVFGIKVMGDNGWINSYV